MPHLACSRASPTTSWAAVLTHPQRGLLGGSCQAPGGAASPQLPGMPPSTCPGGTGTEQASITTAPLVRLTPSSEYSGTLCKSANSPAVQTVLEEKLKLLTASSFGKSLSESLSFIRECQNSADVVRNGRKLWASWDKLL